jgi:RHS repeat-associated protein
MLASLRWLSVIVWAFSVCAYTVRRSARALARKALALALVEVMVVSVSWPLMAGRGLPTPSKDRVMLSQELLSILTKGQAASRTGESVSLPETLPFISKAATSPLRSLMPSRLDPSSVGKRYQPTRSNVLAGMMQSGGLPGINGIQPSSGSPGTAVTITGANFGVSQGIGTITFNGAAATVSSWSDTAIVATVPTGATTGNVQVTTATGSSGGGLFTVLSPGLSIDQSVSTQATTSTGSFTLFGFSTNSSNEVLVAFVSAAQTQDGATTSISNITGGGLTWVPVQKSNAAGGTAEIWRAFAPSALSNASINITANNSGGAGVNFALTVISFIGADTTGTNGSGAIGATATASAPSVALTTTRNNSIVFAVGADAFKDVTLTPDPNQTALNVFNLPGLFCSFPNQCPPFSGRLLWVQQISSAVPGSGTTVTVSDTISITDIVDFSAVEILPAITPASTPLLTSLSAVSGTAGNPITITGTNFGASQGTSAVTFNGSAATPTSWSSNSIAVPVPGNATSGNVVVTVGGQASNGIHLVVTNGGGLGVDQVASVDVGIDASSIVSPPISTSSGNQTLLAFISASAPTHVAFSSVNGATLTWSLVKRTNSQVGTAEIWKAFSPFMLSNVSFKATPSNNINASMTVVAFLGVDPSGANGANSTGATGTGSSGGGTPSATLTSTRKNSLVFGVGTDPTRGAARTPGSSQSLVHQFINVCTPQPPNLCLANASNTLWTQRLNTSVSNSGVNVTINDTAPTSVVYNLSTVEVRPPTVSAPTITDLTPSSGGVGTIVTIAGSNFGSTQGASTVKFGNVQATPTSWTASAIVVPVPSGVSAGAVSVVVNVAGVGASNPATFTTNAPLAISASIVPLPNAAGWNSTNVTISYTCTGGVAPVQCAPPQIVTTEGANQPFTGTATDAAGGHASVTTTLKIDKTPPLVSITSPANNSSVNAGNLAVSGSVSDALSGVAAVTCNGIAATVVSGTFSCSVPLIVGLNTITATAFDVAGNTSSQSITVNVGPKITDFTPKTGPIGTAVSISGTGLSISPNASTVTFAGPNNSQLSARINFASNTQLAVMVPTGAVTGLITVNTSAGSVSTATPFTIGPRQDFAVTVAPGTGSLQQGSNVAFAVSVTSQQTDFTQLASLSVTGLPQGVFAIFNPVQITAGASSSLGVDLSATNLSVGTYPFIVHAVATVDGASVEKTASGTLNVIAAGQTTLSGQVLSTSNEPIVGASVSIDGITVLTDPSGHFFIAGVQPGTNRSLSVDGHSATSPNVTFPLIFEPVNIISGRANVVSTPFHLPPIDTSQEVTIDPNHDTVAGNVSVPNLQMTIPVGANLRMLDGTLVTRTSITPLAPDRTPAPLPSDVGTNIVYTAQPGGAITDIPIPVIYPNLAGLNPGTEVELYAFDHAHVNWFVYGKGMVSTDGRTIAPEINPATGKPYGLPDFSWSFPNTGPNGNPSDPNACPKSRGPNPVDYATGMKIEKVPQVSWGGARGAFKFELIYTTDKVVNCRNCPFGDGWTHNWDIKVSGSFSPGGAGRLIYPDQVTGNLLNSSGTDGSGNPRFTLSTAPSTLGASVLRLPSTTQYRDTDGTLLNFDSSGRLVSRVDNNGNVTSLTYSNGLLVKITDPVGRAITLDYDSSGRVTTMTDPLGRQWHYTYEGTPGVAVFAPGLTTITDPAGGVTKYTYVSPGRIAAVTNARGNVTKQITYDANGRVATQTFADGGTETYNYQLSGTIVSSTAITDPLGRTTTERFDANGYVIGVVNPDGQQTTLQRDLTSSVVTSIVGPCGCTQSARLTTATGDVSSSTNAVGGTIFRDYNPTFHVVSNSTDPLGRVTTYTYDQNGNLLTKTDALNQITTYTYNSFGELTSIADPAGGTSLLEYDPSGNVSATTDPGLKRTTFEYDPLGKLTAVVDPLQRRSTMHYDLLERLDSATDPASNVTKYEYDAVGNRTAIVNPLTKRWTYSYDAKNRLVSKTDPLSHTTSYTYDQGDELISAKTPLGRIIQHTYNKRGLKASTTKPNGDVISYAYDSNGLLTKLTDARGNAITYSYDPAGRPISRTDPLGRTTTNTYDPIGNLTSTVDRFGRQTSYTYDALNRATQLNYSDATVNITYDPDGRITQKDDSTGGTIQWTYDDRGRPISETTSGASVDYSYNDAGQPISTGVRGRVPTQYGYDGFGRLSSISLGTRSFSFQYDQASRRTAVIRPNGITSTYTYDDANRLTHISHANAGGVALEDFAYTTDADGRLISTQSAVNHTLLPASATAGTFDANNRPTQFNASLFSFDDLGELISSTAGQSSTTYQWDGRGRLTGAQLPNGTSVQYSYDAMSRLASRSVNGASTSYVYNGSEVLLRSDSFGNQTDFVNGASQTERLLQTGSLGDLYFLQDRLSNVMSLANSSGALVEQESYEPFGNTTGSGATEYGYIGERFDQATHLMVLNARFYDPVQQRFITEDPIGTGGGLNVFAYSNNDPINASDPSGMYWCGYDSLVCASNIAAGAGDKISLGLTNWIRNKMGTNDVVDKCGLGYQVGGYVGDTVNYSIMVLSLAGPLLEAGAAAAETVEAAEAVETEAGVASELEEMGEACSLCFPAGTEIHTKNGLQQIEKIKVGDEVLSRNTKSGKLEYKKVISLTAAHLDNVLEVSVFGEPTPLRPTPSHPFFAKHRGENAGNWVKASDLRVGDLVLNATGGWSSVTQVSPVKQRDTVYNFEVEENHDYFVGSSGLLVHNGCDIGGGQIFTHFTDAEGVQGITSVEGLEAGETATVDQLTFGEGTNAYNANEAGDIFVTNLAADSSGASLSQIGIQEARQQFAIQMSRETLLENGITPGLSSLSNVFTIPGNSVLNGLFTVARMF